MSELLLKDKLRELRTRKHFTQSKVSQYLNMTRQGYAHYEAGLRNPDYQTLLKLSKLYQVDINELINPKTTPIINDLVHESEHFQTNVENQRPHRVIQLTTDEKKLFNLYSKLSAQDKQDVLHLLENKVRNLKNTNKDDSK